MRKIFLIFMVFGLFVGTPAGPRDAQAQVRAQAGPGDLSGALSRLKSDPRYQGRILGTHIVSHSGRRVYEVRILRPDDRIILVYIDPRTGKVVGDSTSRKNRSTRQRPERRQKSPRRNR